MDNLRLAGSTDALHWEDEPFIAVCTPNFPFDSSIPGPDVTKQG
jgi:hypothetical protein